MDEETRNVDTNATLELEQLKKQLVQLEIMMNINNDMYSHLGGTDYLDQYTKYKTERDALADKISKINI